MSARHSTELRKDKISNLDDRAFNRVAHTSWWETKSLIFCYSFVLPLVTHFLSTFCLLLALSLFPWLHQRGLLMIWSFTKYLFANGCETECCFFLVFFFFFGFFCQLPLWIFYSFSLTSVIFIMLLKFNKKIWGMGKELFLQGSQSWLFYSANPGTGDEKKHF